MSFGIGKGMDARNLSQQNSDFKTPGYSIGPVIEMACCDLEAAAPLKEFHRQVEKRASGLLARFPFESGIISALNEYYGNTAVT